MENQLVIKELQLLQMPGIPRGLNTLSDLSPHINIIAGANASGKSSTARAIQHILWQDKDISNDVRLNSIVEVNETTLQVKRTGKNREVTRNNENVSFPLSLLEESKTRYFLSLHELIKGEDSDLAKTIMDQAVGGYNLKAVIDKLGYRIPSNRILNPLSKDATNAEKKVREIQKKQSELKNKENSLQQLEVEKINAEKAKIHADFFKLIQELHEAEHALEESKQHLSLYPSEIAHLKEDDYSNLEKARQTVEKHQINIEQLIAKNAELNEILGVLNLPETGINEQVIEELEETYKQLHTTDSDLNKATLDLSGLQSQLTTAESQLGEEVVRGLQENRITELVDLSDSFWQELLETRGNLLKQRAYVKSLEEKRVETNDSEVLQKGVTALSNWLRATAGEFTGIPLSASLSLAGVMLLTVFTVYFLGIWGFAGIPIAGILLYHWHTSILKKNTSLADHQRKEYESTKLSSPEKWNPEGISTLIERLTKDIYLATAQRELEIDIHREKKALSILEEKNERLKETLHPLRDKLCLLPALSDIDTEPSQKLFWYYNQIKEWLELKSNIEGEIEKISVYKNNFADYLKNINEHLTACNRSPSTTKAQALAEINALKKAINTWRDCTSEIRNNQREIARLSTDIASLKESRTEIIQRLGISDENVARVKELTDQLDAYRKAVQQQRDCEGNVLNQRGRVERDAQKAGFQDTWMDIPFEGIDQRIADLELEASKKDGLISKIAEIKTEIHSTVSSNALQHALSAFDAELVKLEDSFNEQARLLTGDILARHVQKALGDSNMPEVFHRAKDLFTQITKGRYELRIPSAEKPDFEAFDTLTSDSKSLEKLSSGTRIQLLIAVRLAFIETAEGTTIRLPILADELLANSDSVRAEAIIEALTAISKAGRQLFYFTAQEDEAAKWQQYLEKHPDIKPAIFTLSENFFASGNAVKKSIPIHPSLRIEIPSPQSETHQSYGEILNVPPFDPFTNEIEEIHLWYLTENLIGLHALLTNGIAQYGTFRNYVTLNGTLTEFTRDEIKQIDVAAAMVKFYSELLRYGNDKPVTASQLLDSGYVSETFVPEIIALIEELNGNPSELIQAIREKRVKNFRKTEELDSWLRENEFISKNVAYNEEEKRIRLLAWLSNQPIENEEAEKILSRIFWNFPKKNLDK